MASDKCELKEDCLEVFEVARVDNCFGGLGCPAIYGTPEKPDTYFVVGKKIDPQESRFATKVGKDEQVIAIPKILLDKLSKEK
ncbi:hypothetical protein J4208_05415 [Candidatus Woesearchaeota archaeon]|nr:hypothetical protein [Candidatus Woesearchaeota archaeon]